MSCSQKNIEGFIPREIAFTKILVLSPELAEKELLLYTELAQETIISTINESTTFRALDIADSLKISKKYNLRNASTSEEFNKFFKDTKLML